MRDILNKLLILKEATGLAGRKPGDPFQNSAGETITFSSIQFFPKGGGKYTPEELEHAFIQVSKENPNIEWQNAKTSRVGGFALVTFDGENGPVTIGRFLGDIKADPRQNSLGNSFTIDGDTWKLSSKTAKKEQSGLSPLDLLSDRELQTIPSIMTQLASKLGEDNPLYMVAQQIANGHPLPITFAPPEGIEFSAFRDYFCEILQPIALQKGQFTGNAMDAVNRFLNGTLEGTMISFGATKTGGLTDSVLSDNEGRTLLISSKGGRGAEASATNLYNEVQKLKNTPEGNKFLKKYKKEVQILDDIVKSGMHNAPLKLALDYNLLNDEEVEQIKALRKLPKIDMANVGGLNLSSRLKTLAQERKPANPQSVNIYFHLMAVIANKVAKHINNTTDFPEAAADILNNGALVQVYTKAREGKGKWTLDDFETVYPGEAIKGVFLSSEKNYYSTIISGNFTFFVDKGKGGKEEQKVPTQATEPEVPVPTTEPEFAGQAAQIAGEPIFTKKDKTQKITKPKDTGRKKRK